MLAAGHRMGQQQAQQQMAQAEAYKQQGAQEAMAAAPAAPAQDDVIAQIEKLSALHQSGALTDEEFAAARRSFSANPTAFYLESPGVCRFPDLFGGYVPLARRIGWSGYRGGQPVGCQIILNSILGNRGITFDIIIS